jgi:hypothetical protein
MPSNDNFKKTSQHAYQTLKTGETWLSDARAKNPDDINLHTIWDLQTQRRKVETLITATQAKACIGLFGESQVGKSNVTNTLAAPPGEQLNVLIGSKSVGYADKIDPGGNKETTGIVTRFVFDSPQAVNNDYPICVNFMAEADVIKVLINTYCHEIDHTRIDEAEKESYYQDDLAWLRDYEPIELSTKDGGLDENAILGIRDYIKDNAEINKNSNKVSDDYWLKLIAVMPNLTILEDRIRALSPLWGGLSVYSELYRCQRQALEKLNFSFQGFCQDKAFFPKETSIIAVKALEQIFSLDSNDMVNIQCVNNITASLHRPVLAALVKELVLQIDSQPYWPFQQYADLLDFPGARGRGIKYTVQDFIGQKSDLKAKAMLRGKVDYLFDDYRSNRVLTSAIYCIGPGNQDVIEGIKKINEWTNDLASRLPVILNLTMFDMYIGPKDNQTAAAMMTNSMEQTFEPVHMFDFIQSNQAGTPFKDVVCFRNPFLADARMDKIFNYEEDIMGEVKAEQKPWLEELKQGFISAKETQTYIGEPERAWEEVLKLDGGASYLVSRLENVFTATTQQEQFTSLLNRILKKSDDVLRPKWISDNADDEMKKIEEKLISFEQQMNNCAVSNQQSTLFSFLFLSESECYQLLRNVEWQVKQGHDNKEVFAKETANYILLEWEKSLTGILEQPKLLNKLSINTSELKLVVDELIKAMKRCDLKKEFSSAIYSISNNVVADQVTTSRKAKVCSEILSKFIRDLGMALLSDEDTPKRKGDSSTTIFSQQPPVIDLPNLAEAPVNHAEIYRNDWLQALNKMIELNFETPDGFDVKANAKLGEILVELKNIQQDLSSTIELPDEHKEL